MLKISQLWLEDIVIGKPISTDGGNFLLTVFIVLAGTVDCRVRQDTRGLTQYWLLPATLLSC